MVWLWCCAAWPQETCEHAYTNWQKFSSILPCLAGSKAENARTTVCRKRQAEVQTVMLSLPEPVVSNFSMRAAREGPSRVKPTWVGKNAQEHDG